jgi:hypothetical protein
VDGLIVCELCAYPVSWNAIIIDFLPHRGGLVGQAVVKLWGRTPQQTVDDWFADNGLTVSKVVRWRPWPES